MAAASTSAFHCQAVVYWRFRVQGRRHFWVMDLAGMKNSSGPRQGGRPRTTVGIYSANSIFDAYCSVVEMLSLLRVAIDPGGLKRAIEPNIRDSRRPGCLFRIVGIGKDFVREIDGLSVQQQRSRPNDMALDRGQALVLADEPTSSLDADRRREFISLLVSECGRANSTIIFVSHDVSLATHFDVAIDLQRTNAAAHHSNAA